MNAEIKDRLITARVQMLLKHPFFGPLATRMKLVESEKYKTAATNGRDIFYNPSFVESLTDSELQFLIGHELLHAVYDHIPRTGERDQMIANIAQDFVVNADLITHGIGDFIKSGLYDPKYKGWTFEEVYDDLMSDPNMQQLSELRKELAGKLLDEHVDGASEDGLSEEEQIEAGQAMQAAVIEAAKSAAGSGNVPSSVDRFVKDLVEPKINWRELLAQSIESTIRSNFSWMRPSRKGQHMDAVMPAGMIPEEAIDVCVAIDTSGSINTTMLRDFVSEIKGIMDSYADYNLNIWCFDTKVHNHRKFCSYNSDEITDYELKGFGGTEFTANWEFMKEHNIEPKLLVMFTDGYPRSSWGDPNYCDTLFVIHSSKTIEPPFGSYAHYEY
jgi:predicted metal-dependent peptidase